MGAHQQEAADITAITVAAMAAGQAKLQKQKESISIEKVERLTDDIAEVTEDLNDITDLLSKPLGMAAADDEDEFAAEFERMRRSTPPNRCWIYASQRRHRLMRRQSQPVQCRRQRLRPRLRLDCYSDLLRISKLTER